MKIAAIKGFNDILPEQAAVWRHIESVFHRVLGAWGYGEIRLPLLEYTELFARSIGGETDIVEKEMYTFSDRSGRSLTLRPEGTASMVRAWVQHTLGAPAEVGKFRYVGPMFRYERPQKGRYRQFYQLGAEVFGDESFYQDAEMLIMLARFFHEVGVEGTKLHLNSLGCQACRPHYRDELQHFLADRVDRLCDDCRRRVPQNPLRALDCKQPACREVVAVAPRILDYLDAPCREHFAGVTRLLTAAGVEYEIDQFMVRGLDYYSRTTFEFLAGELGAQNAVGAGGRYDNLVAELGGRETPAIGFAVGMERLAMLVATAAGAPPTEGGVALTALGAPAIERLFPLQQELCAAGIRALLNYREKSLKSLLKKADRDGVRYVLIVGDQELEREEATLRDMSTGEQRTVLLTEVVPTMRRMIHGRQDN
ncbi:MAG: histidine--tRNA ligase [Deltaproteobacteria bacterium]|nr:histidine--tRNA ligase [Candidatus Anaeroferrophillacea bacterium]